MTSFNFGPARKEESIVFGAAKPGSRGKDVQAWGDFMKSQGIQRVCCLLSSSQLVEFEEDLLAIYRKHFGADHVCDAPIKDYHLVDRETLEGRIIPFLRESDKCQKPVVVHCWSGNGRTGHILAAWLVRGHGLQPRDALLSVIKMGRKPREAVDAGNATEKDLLALLSAPSSDSI